MKKWLILTLILAGSPAYASCQHEPTMRELTELGLITSIDTQNGAKVEQYFQHHCFVMNNERELAQMKANNIPEDDWALSFPQNVLKSEQAYELLKAHGINIHTPTPDGSLLPYLTRKPVTYTEKTVANQLQYIQEARDMASRYHLSAQFINEFVKSKYQLLTNENVQKKLETQYAQLFNRLMHDYGPGLEDLKREPSQNTLAHQFAYFGRIQNLKTLNKLAPGVLNAKNVYGETPFLISLRPYCAIKPWQESNLLATQLFLVEKMDNAALEMKNNHDQGFVDYLAHFKNQPQADREVLILALEKKLGKSIKIPSVNPEFEHFGDNEYCED